MTDQNLKQWSAPRIDDLLQWSKSLKQFRSVFLNMSQMEWLRVKDVMPDGAQAAVRASTMVVEQAVNPGELGFHGCSAAAAKQILNGIKRQSQNGYLADWKAFYLGSGPEHSLGYIEPSEAPGAGAQGVLLVVSTSMPLKRIFISNIAVPPGLDSQAKAFKIKELLGLDRSAVLMDELGKQNKFIEMTDSEDNTERIIPWAIAERYCSAKDSGIPITYDKQSMKFSLALA